jgi:hypothetical protein
MTTVFLFLDFDGVLHPYFPLYDRSDEENKHLAYIPNLEAVLRDYDYIKIVISSDWRKNHSLEELRNMFSPDIAKNIIGVTPVLEKEFMVWEGHRQKEILSFLENIGEKDATWIALDDDVSNFFKDSPLIFCADGFRLAEETALRNYLMTV